MNDLTGPALDALVKRCRDENASGYECAEVITALRAERDAALSRESAAYARGVQAAAKVIDTAGDGAVTEALSTQLCCNGHHADAKALTLDRICSTSSVPLPTPRLRLWWG